MSITQILPTERMVKGVTKMSLNGQELQNNRALAENIEEKAGTGFTYCKHEKGQILHKKDNWLTALSKLAIILYTLIYTTIELLSKRLSAPRKTGGHLGACHEPKELQHLLVEVPSVQWNIFNLQTFSSDTHNFSIVLLRCKSSPNEDQLDCFSSFRLHVRRKCFCLPHWNVGSSLLKLLVRVFSSEVTRVVVNQLRNGGLGLRGFSLLEPPVEGHVLQLDVVRLPAVVVPGRGGKIFPENCEVQR